MYDLRDTEFLRNPAPQLTRMRADGALVRARLPILGPIWLTTTDAFAREVLKDQTRFTRAPSQISAGRARRVFWWMPRFMRPLLKNINLMDGEDHKRLRGLVDQAFARSSTEQLLPQITAIADDLLDQINHEQPVEIISTYARALPLLVICALLGIPEEDRAKITRWIAPISSVTGISSIFLGLPGLRRAMRYFKEDFERVRRAPRPGLISDLVRVEADGDRLSEDELLSLVFTLFVAGHETTVHLISNAIWALSGDDATREHFQSQPDLAPLAVEEFMRVFSPVLMSKSLYAKEDFHFHGTEVKRGEAVCALLIAANHDPARFTAPDELHLDRRPNPHLGFGHGPHVCLGMQLARAEARIALERLFSRFPDLEMAHPDTPPVPARRIGMNGLKRLILRLRP